MKVIFRSQYIKKASHKWIVPECTQTLFKVYKAKGGTKASVTENTAEPGTAICS